MEVLIMTILVTWMDHSELGLIKITIRLCRHTHNTLHSITLFYRIHVNFLLMWNECLLDRIHVD
jgi:hypothetical protein